MSDKTCVKDLAVEAISELVYDLEKEGQLIDAEAVRKSLKLLKSLTEEAVQALVDSIIKEQEVGN